MAPLRHLRRRRRHSPSQGGAPSAAADSQAAADRATPFREAQVEQVLYGHLRAAGYEVVEQVAVPSGVVDAVATRGESGL
jgi:hypothetical protein